jgi:uncharacterized protein
MISNRINTRIFRSTKRGPLEQAVHGRLGPHAGGTMMFLSIIPEQTKAAKMFYDGMEQSLPMNLSDSEKLILMMLSDIHKHLKIKNGTDAEFVQSAILSGNTWGLYWKFPGIFEGQGETPANVHEVLEILEMWEAIELSYDKLSADDKARMKAEENPFVSHPRFSGFDGNNETEYMGIAHFLVDELGRFTHFKGRDLNSHMPLSLDGYRRMLTVYRQSPFSPLHPDELTSTQITEILREQLHPERRR